MFKGFGKELREKLEKQNQENDKFVFSIGDLELVEINDKKRKCRIISEELSKELQKLVSGGSKPTFIEFNFFTSYHYNDSTFHYYNDSIFSNTIGHSSYEYWLTVDKEILKNSKIFGETLFINSSFITAWPTDSLSDYATSIEEYNKKPHQTIQARTSALQAINNTIQNGNIDFTTLKEAMFFLGESYLQVWPNDCLYCPKEYEKNPENVAEYHKTHINKCLWRPDRINDFKDSQIALIQRIITQFNTHKNTIIQQIIKKAQEQGISEAELNTTRPNWQNHLRSLKNRTEISNYQTNQLEKDIENLVSAKKKSGEERQQAEAAAKEKVQQEEEKLKKEREEKEKKEFEAKKKKDQEDEQQAKEQAKQLELNQKRVSFITEITTALNQEPKLINSDLSSQYQNWPEQINGLTDIQQITNLQARLLADIQARRQDKKSAQEVKEDLKKAQTGTKEEKEQAWKNLEKQETEKGYHDNQQEVEKLQKEKATENPQEYGKEAKKRIEEKLNSNGIKEEELSNENRAEWQRLKNGEIQDPDQLVATETKIKQNIYQTEAKKKVVTLTARVNEVLKLPTKDQIATVKKLLLEFLSSSNIYYSAQRKNVENLLTQLENCSVLNNDHNNSSVRPNRSPWKIIVPLLLIGLLLVMTLVVLRKKTRKWK